MITKLWYSVRNGGDGSAYPYFMESEELCELDQKWMDEGWGEPCIGCLILESKSPIVVKTDNLNEEIITVEMEIAEIEEELNEDYMIEYKKAGEYPDWVKRLEGKLKELKILQSRK